MATQRQVILDFNLQDRASPGLKNLEGNLSRVDVEANMAAAALSKGSGGLPGLTPAMLGVGGAVAGVAAGIGKLTTEYVANTRELNRGAEAARISVYEYSALSHAFQQLGFDQSDLIAIQNELQLKLAETPEVFEEIGLSAAELRKQQPDEVLRQVAGALREIDDNQVRVSLADQLLGGDDALKLAQVAGDLERLTDEAKRFGIAITDEQARQAEEFGRHLDTIKTAGEGAVNAAGAAFINLTGGIVAEIARIASGAPTEAEKAAQMTVDALLAKSDEAAAAGRIFGQSARTKLAEQLGFMEDDARKTADAIINILNTGGAGAGGEQRPLSLSDLPPEITRLYSDYRQGRPSPLLYANQSDISSLQGIFQDQDLGAIHQAILQLIDSARSVSRYPPGESAPAGYDFDISGHPDPEFALQFYTLQREQQLERIARVQRNRQRNRGNIYDENVYNAPAGGRNLNELLEEVFGEDTAGGRGGFRSGGDGADEESGDGGGGGRGGGSGGSPRITLNLYVQEDGRDRIEQILTDAVYDEVVPALSRVLEEKGCGDD